MAGQVCHPTVPKCLWRICRTHQVEGKEVPGVTGIRHQYGAGDDECEAYASRS